jgi:hypothetical protein
MCCEEEKERMRREGEEEKSELRESWKGVLFVKDFFGSPHPSPPLKGSGKVVNISLSA